MKALLLSVLMCSVPVWAQPLSVYSELAKIDAAGKVTAPETPREILSPALVRNGFTSFQVVIEAPAETKWWLFVGQNPENSVKVTMYRELGGALMPVDLPYASVGTQALWMDLWTDENARVQRIKVEPELNINDDWVIYPIEGRVTEARVPQGPIPAASIQKFVCGPVEAGATALRLGTSIEGLRARNGQQDVKLLDAHATSTEDVKKMLGGCDAPLPPDPEWYLGIRDYLLRLR